MNQRDLVELHSHFLKAGWQIKADKTPYGYAYLLEKGHASANIAPSANGFRTCTVDKDGKVQKLDELAENVAWLEVERFIDSESRNL